MLYCFQLVLLVYSSILFFPYPCFFSKVPFPLKLIAGTGKPSEFTVLHFSYQPDSIESLSILPTIFIIIQSEEGFIWLPITFVRLYYLVLSKLVVGMEDYACSDEDYNGSDQESLDGFENEDTDFQLVTTKGPTTQVFVYGFPPPPQKFFFFVVRGFAEPECLLFLTTGASLLF